MDQQGGPQLVKIQNLLKYGAAEKKIENVNLSHSMMTAMQCHYNLNRDYAR